MIVDPLAMITCKKSDGRALGLPIIHKTQVAADPLITSTCKTYEIVDSSSRSLVKRRLSQTL